MYQLQEKPDEEIILESGGRKTPLATLKDEHGGIAQIAIDDHCYVLYLGHYRMAEDEGESMAYRIAAHWFSEAVAVLKKMPMPK